MTYHARPQPVVLRTIVCGAGASPLLVYFGYHTEETMVYPVSRSFVSGVLSEHVACLWLVDRQSRVTCNRSFRSGVSSCLRAITQSRFL